MHVNIRRFLRIGVAQGVIEQSVEHELLPDLRSKPGFRGYLAFWDEEDAGVSVSVFEDSEAAHRSTDSARRWLARHPDFFPERGEEFSGECLAHEVPSPGNSGAGEGEPLPYVLVRMLEGVPATQDTQAFVQQRTLPVIARWPGFQGVYMARSDRDEGRAAVVTLFGEQRDAEACHDAAVTLLREGLPSIAVTRVVHGRCVIACFGGA